MKTADVLREVKIPRDKLYYLENKGYIKPRRIPKGEMEVREYSQEDVVKIKLIWKYLQQGFKHRIAYQKALEELEQVKSDSGAAG